jgi:hypothetical protein
MTTDYVDLLTLCAFSESEIKKEKDRIDAAFNKLGLQEADIARAVVRVKKNFDIELEGVRRTLGIWIKELFDAVLSRDEGKKLIYFGYPPFQYIGMAIKAATESKHDFYVGCPEIVLCQTLGQIFDKLTPLLETGEAAGMVPGHAMCALLQIKNGAFEKGILPTPDLSIATSYFCDMGPKCDELLQYRHGFPVKYIDSCMDALWGEYPDFDPERVRYLGAQLNKLFNDLKEMFGIIIDDKAWQGAHVLSAKLYEAINKLTRFTSTDPVPLRAADLELVFNIPLACTGVAFEQGPDAVEILAKEVEARVQKGFGVVPKGAPRVMLFFQSLSDPKFTRIIEDAGIAIPVVSALLPPRKAPESSPYESLAERRAEQAMYGGAYHSGYGYIKRMEEGLDFCQVDGIIYNYQFSCRPLVCDGKLLKTFMEKQTGLPTLLLEMDYYDTRNYSEASLRTRIEAFAEMLYARQTTNTAGESK